MNHAISLMALQLVANFGLAPVLLWFLGGLIFQCISIAMILLNKKIYLVNYAIVSILVAPSTVVAFVILEFCTITTKIAVFLLKDDLYEEAN